MKQNTLSNSISGLGLVTAIIASSCCITPVIALIAGTSGAALSITWLEPARPFFIGLTIATLGLAWYRLLRNKINTNCGHNGICAVANKHFITSKTFLGIISILAIAFMTFPYFVKIFYPYPKTQLLINLSLDNKQQVEFTIYGMTCEACEDHVNAELLKVDGVIASNTSYTKRNSVVTFDKSKVDLKTIKAAIDKTGYLIKGYNILMDNPK